MRYRPLGRSGILVSEIGFGAWGIGGLTDGQTSYGDTDDAVSLRALQRAFDQGITFFDTSSVYGYGRSEELIGRALGCRRTRVVVATKAGYQRWDRSPNFSPAEITISVEGSLRRLKTDYIDLLQLHNSSIELTNQDDVRETLSSLVQAGKIRLWGVSAKSPAEAIDLLRVVNIAAVQVNFNMLDVRAATLGLLDEASRRGIGIIARTPLCFGFLSGKILPSTIFPPGDHRLGWPRSQLDRWIEGARELLATVQTTSGVTATQIALRFCLSFPAVSTVIPGMLNTDEVDENIAASGQGPLPAAAVDAVLAINQSRNFFVNLKNTESKETSS